MDCRTAGYLHGYTLKEAQNITDPLKKPQVSPADILNDFGMEPPADAPSGTIGGVPFADPTGIAGQGFPLAGTSPQATSLQAPLPPQAISPPAIPSPNTTMQNRATQNSTMQNSVAGMPEGITPREDPLENNPMGKIAALQIILKRK